MKVLGNVKAVGYTGVYRGERPQSFKDLRAFHIQTVINLQSGFFETLTSSDYEFEEASDFGMTEVNIECSDFTPPTYEQVIEFLNCIQFNMDKDKRVFVHCLHGKDRTGFMIAMFRISFCEWPIKDAIKEMYANGFHKFPYFYWVPFIYKYAWKIRSEDE